MNLNTFDKWEMVNRNIRTLLRRNGHFEWFEKGVTVYSVDLQKLQWIYDSFLNGFLLAAMENISSAFELNAWLSTLSRQLYTYEEHNK